MLMENLKILVKNVNGKNPLLPVQKVFCFVRRIGWFYWCQNIQHYDIQHNDIQHNVLIYDAQHNSTQHESINRASLSYVSRF